MNNTLNHALQTYVDGINEIAALFARSEDFEKQKWAAQLKTAAMEIEDVADQVKTANAVGELVQVAFEKNGGKGDSGAMTLRRKAA